MLQLENNATQNEIKTVSAQFRETIPIKVYRSEAADGVVFECLERWSQSVTFMNALVERIVSILMFILPVAGFIKQHVDATIDECRLMQLHAESGQVNKKRVLALPSRSTSYVTENSENTRKR